MTKMELLAPAGNAAAALAAFDAGADAIYAGLPKFNARERGENFSPESMGQIIEYAHRLGRKVYVTVNTIVKQQELPEVAEYLALLSDLAPDALIVQDMGVLRMVREYFPDLCIHGSTQMGFHNSAGLKMAEELGIRRVILERQVTFDEIMAMRRESRMELEIFVHGALCCSLSGQCLFSSWLGGASGNRGRCKQPCRRRFYHRDGNGFFFSPQDLCLIDRLDEIESLGVASLKIEGRLRQPDYVANTVAAYRMMLDTPPADRPERLGEAKALLGRTCGRRWSHGFADDSNAAGLIAHENIGAAGQLCGTVSELRDNGFAFRTGKRIHVGDRLRVQPKSGDEGAAVTVTRMFVDNRSAMFARPGTTVFVCCDKAMPFGGVVFKIGESFSDYSGRITALPMPRRKLALTIAADRDGITVSCGNAPLADWHAAWELAPAERRALDAETLTGCFRMADSDVFAAGQIECQIRGDWFCPAQQLKQVRRAFWQYVHENLTPGSVFRAADRGMERFRQELAALVPAASETAPETVAAVPGGETPGNPKAIRAASVFELDKFCREAILPEFCPEGRLRSLERAIAAAYDRGIRRFRVTALYALPLLAGYRGITIVAGGALPVANAMAVAELQQHGAGEVLAHVELERQAVEALAAASPLPVQLYRFGRPALLVTRAAIPVNGDFRDGRGNAFTVVTDRRDHLTRIYPRKILSVPRVPGLRDFYDIRCAHWSAEDTETFNFESELL